MEDCRTPDETRCGVEEEKTGRAETKNTKRGGEEGAVEWSGAVEDEPSLSTTRVVALWEIEEDREAPSSDTDNF